MSDFDRAREVLANHDLAHVLDELAAQVQRMFDDSNARIVTLERDLARESRAEFKGELDRARTFLASIATALPQSEQAGWMVATAKDGLRWTDDGGEST